jgi:uncharacterized spore protein YtfJ
MDITAPKSAQPTNGKLDGELARAAAEIAHMLEHEGNVNSVFGAPVKLDTKTVIPVAFVNVGSGGGGVFVPAARRFFERIRRLLPARVGAGGGGVGIHVRPIGYLHEEDGHVVFSRIEIGARPAR